MLAKEKKYFKILTKRRLNSIKKLIIDKFFFRSRDILVGAPPGGTESAPVAAPPGVCTRAAMPAAAAPAARVEVGPFAASVGNSRGGGCPSLSAG